MPSAEIEEFAKRLVQVVRDRAISSCDNTLRPIARGPGAERLKALAETGIQIEFAKALIDNCVDTAVFFLLDAIDNDLLKLSYTSESGRVVDLNKEGHWELAGWYMGHEGWRQAYSEERVYTPDLDLKNFKFDDD